MLDDGLRREWEVPEEFSEFESVGLWLGTGNIPLEVRVVKTTAVPRADRVGAMWRTVQNRRPAPMLLIVQLPTESGKLVMTCGPTGEKPPVRKGLASDFVAKIATAAIEQPDRHAAVSLLEKQLMEGDEDFPGITNTVISQHVLTECLSSAENKEKFDRGHPEFGGRSGRSLVEALGYGIDPLPDNHHLLTVDLSNTAIAIFLDRDETFDHKNQRFGNQTPIASAFSQAKNKRVEYVIAVKERQIRIYPTKKTEGSSRQIHNSYLEANLDLLPTQNHWQLQMLCGSHALQPATDDNEGGLFAGLLAATERYSLQLGGRLRERIYDQVVPKLANLMAQTQTPGERLKKEQLNQLYETALTILFRLLFVAYSEDQDLLPYQQNSTYQARSLKAIAHILAQTANQASDISRLEDGSVFEENSYQYWESICGLFRAIDRGNREWGVPEYNGGMFSAKAEINPAGAAIEAMQVNNQQIGPVLFHLLIDQVSDDGEWGAVDFRQLAAREFGTIYEGLLEAEMVQAETDLTTNKQGHFLPAKEDDEIVKVEGEIFLLQQSGIRKSTGTYFTPKFAVDHLLEKSLQPAIEEHLAKIEGLLDQGEQDQAAEQLLQFRVADIAMGSGHFLTAAIDMIGDHFTVFLQDHPIPPFLGQIEQLRQIANEKLSKLHLDEDYEIDDLSLLRRLIARHCIYGVDINRLAVDLARLAISAHTFIPGLPLSFLDHNLICGDSLIGIGTIDEVLEHDLEKMEIVGLTRYLMEQFLDEVKPALKQLAQLNDATPTEIEQARAAQDAIKLKLEPLRKLFNIMISHRVIDGLAKFDINIDQKAIDTYPDLDQTEGLAHELNPIHFPLAFPEVFTGEEPGFHCLVGNPPWDKVKIEEHAWWATYYPGIRSLEDEEFEIKKMELREDRPDLYNGYKDEVRITQRLKMLIREAPYHPSTTGDTDTYRAFAWRYEGLLLRPLGQIGVVMPAGLISGKGNSKWRHHLFNSGGYSCLVKLINNKKWFHEKIHGQLSLFLVSFDYWASREREREREFLVSGPIKSIHQWKNRTYVKVKDSELKSWSSDLVLSTFPSQEHKELYAKFKLNLTFEDEQHIWYAVRPTELHPSADKKHMITNTNQDVWPVYKGESCNIWNPDTRSYYRTVDPNYITEVLYQKRQNSTKRKNQHFYVTHQSGANTIQGCSQEWIDARNTLACYSPRITIRDTTNSTNKRTCIASLVPGNRVLTGDVPYLFFRKGNTKDQAFVLGVLSSMVLDWFARLFVEGHMNYAMLKELVFPNPDREDPLRRRVEVIAGRMATKEKGHPGFKEWAEAVGVEEGSVSPEEEPELLAELDAVVAILYGLELEDLKFIYDTFHPTSDYSDRYRLAAKYWEAAY